MNKLSTKQIRRNIKKAHKAFMSAGSLEAKKAAQSDIQYWTLQDTKAISTFVRRMNYGN